MSHPSVAGNATIAIATTILHPPQSLLTWLDYHLLFVHLILIFLDDPSLRPTFLSLIGHDRPVLLLDGASDHPSMAPASRTILRQRANLDAAIAHLLADDLDLDFELPLQPRLPRSDWLLHIDPDELLHDPSRTNRHAWSQDPSLGHVRFTNHEAVPLRHPTTAPFSDCTLFKPNGGPLPFMAYANGKSAVRLSKGVRPLGPHAFTGFTGRDLILPPPGRDAPVLLHYPTSTFHDWRDKYTRYGAFSDFWFDDRTAPVRVEFMLRSRDQVQRALDTGSWGEARAFFEGWVVDDPEVVRGALEDGSLRRFSPLEDARVAEPGGGRGHVEL